MRGILLVMTGVVMLAAPAMGTVMLSDGFDSYTLGNLVPQGTWASHSGTGSNPVQVVSGTPAGDKEISLTQASGSREDVYRSLGVAMGAGDKWYAGYTVKVTGTVTSNDYFASFYQLLSGSNYFPSKVGVTTMTGSDYTFYLHQGSASGTPSAPSATTQSWATGFAFGSEHRLVVSYEYSTGKGELWVDPVCSLGADGNTKIEVINTAGSSLIEADRYAFRQGSNTAGTQAVDDVRVATTWAEACVPEPATIGLLVAGGLFVTGRRRAT